MKLIGRSFASVPAVPQVPVEEAVEELPYLVRRGRQLIAGFAHKSDAGNWARDYSNLRDMQSTFIVHTATEILDAYRDGNEVEVP